MRGILLPLLLFFWINGQSEGCDVHTGDGCDDYHNCKAESYANLVIVTKCVEAPLCEDQHGSICPPGQVCEELDDGSLRCKTFYCDKGAKHECPPGQECIGLNTGAYSCKPVACGGRSNGTCKRGKVCENDGPPEEPSYSCKPAECSPQDPRSCRKDEFCKVTRPHCEKALCGKPANQYGTCPQGKFCKSEKPNGSGPFSCVKKPCPGSKEGTCPDKKQCKPFPLGGNYCA